MRTFALLSCTAATISGGPAIQLNRVKVLTQNAACTLVRIDLTYVYKHICFQTTFTFNYIYFFKQITVSVSAMKSLPSNFTYKD